MKRYCLTITSFFIAAIAYCQEGSLLAVNKGNNTVSLIDLAANKETTAISVGDGPHEVAASPDGNWAVVCNYGGKSPNNSLSVIDMKLKTVSKTISLGSYQRPHGIEFINDKEVIVTSEVTQTLIKVNIETNAVEEVVRTGQKG